MSHQDVRCKRISRICGKIIELLNDDVDGDVEEFLGNIQKIFLLICERFHTDIDSLEDDCEKPAKMHDITHSNIEEMYAQVTQKIYGMKTSLAYEGRGWIRDVEEEAPCLPSPVSEVSHCSKPPPSSPRSSSTESPKKEKVKQNEPTDFIRSIVTEVGRKIERETELPIFDVIRQVGEAIESRIPSKEL